MLKGQGEVEQHGDGGKRESSKGRGRFDLFPYEAMEALAIWFEQGAEKYGDRNWENGLSVQDSINRMIRHAIKAGNGWTDEDHLAAVMWNAACAITMIKRKPEFNDHPWWAKPSGVISVDEFLDEHGVEDDFRKAHTDEELKAMVDRQIQNGVNATKPKTNICSACQTKK